MPFLHNTYGTPEFPDSGNLVGADWMENLRWANTQRSIPSCTLNFTQKFTSMFTSGFFSPILHLNITTSFFHHNKGIVLCVSYIVYNAKQLAYSSQPTETAGKNRNFSIFAPSYHIMSYLNLP